MYVYYIGPKQVGYADRIVHSTLTLLLCIPFVDGLIKVGLFPVNCLCDYCAVLIIGLCS